MLQQPAPAPPLPPTVPAPVVVGGDGRVIIGGQSTSPAAIYEAARARGRELSNQLERLEDRRNELSERLRQVGDEVDRKGIQQQITELDARITSVNQQIAQSDQQIAQAAGIPGAIVPEKPPQHNGPPDEVFIIPIVFTIFVLFPLAIAYARRIWRRSSVGSTVLTLPPEMTERMDRLEHAVESVAEEVERIGEGQRFVTKLFADPGARPQVEAPR